MKKKMTRLVLVITFILIASLVIEKLIPIVSNLKYEYVDNKLTMKDPEKISYTDIDDFLERINNELPYSNIWINDYAYTINENGLEEPLYNALYNSDEYIRVGSNAWLIYDLAVNDQYCYSKKIDPDKCYVSDEEYKSANQDTAEGMYNIFYNSGQVLSSNGDITTYASKHSDELLKAIDNAYIISQGEGTPGYEEAMRASYEIYKGDGSMEKVMDLYEDSISKYNKELSTLKDMSLEDIIANYNTYDDVIYEISRNLALGNLKYKG